MTIKGTELQLTTQRAFEDHMRGKLKKKPWILDHRNCDLLRDSSLTNFVLSYAFFFCNLSSFDSGTRLPRGNSRRQCVLIPFDLIRT